MSEQPHAYVQYKNTDICIDFHCECDLDDPDGNFGHFDGYGAYAIKCANCGRLYEMPTIVQLTPVESTTFTPVLADGREEN